MTFVRIKNYLINNLYWLSLVSSSALYSVSFILCWKIITTTWITSQRHFFLKKKEIQNSFRFTYDLRLFRSKVQTAQSERKVRRLRVSCCRLRFNCSIQTVTSYCNFICIYTRQTMLRLSPFLLAFPVQEKKERENKWSSCMCVAGYSRNRFCVIGCLQPGVYCLDSFHFNRFLLKAFASQ